ncbi:MAG: hypothetical protein ACW97Z_09600 [Candidatus Hodarchaeales archaeon]|jgi:hypothetical protein
MTISERLELQDKIKTVIKDLGGSITIRGDRVSIKTRYRGKKLKFLPECITELKNFKIFTLKDFDTLLSSASEFRAIPEKVEQWILELEAQGCQIHGISTQRIKALQSIPRKEREFIKKLELYIGLLPTWEEVEAFGLDKGDCYSSFFRVRDNNLTNIRLSVLEDYRYYFEELSDHLEEIKYLPLLQELTIEGYRGLWPKVREILERDFPERFTFVQDTTIVEELGCFSEEIEDKWVFKYWSDPGR